MMEYHPSEAGAEVMFMSSFAGAAVAMRYVSSDDPSLDAWRVTTGQALMERFNPAPSAPLKTITEESR
jgi:hypothetical protein